MNDVSFNRLDDFKDLAVTPGVGGREPGQDYWHGWIAMFCRDMTVLDVGAGVSKLKADLLASGASAVVTQDPCAWCKTDLTHDVVDLAAAGPMADVVVSTDVIEHIVDYGRWVRALVLLARKFIIVTTPGGATTRNQNQCHYHEFVPNEVVQLFEAAGSRLHAVRFYAGTKDHSVNFGPEILDATGNEARRVCVTRLDVHPMGFVFEKP